MPYASIEGQNAAVTSQTNLITEIALCSGSNGTGATVANELPSTGGYTRQSVAWTSADAGTATSTATLTFTLAANTTVAFWAGVDSSGNMVGGGPFDEEVTFSNAGPVTYPAGSFTIQAV